MVSILFHNMHNTSSFLVFKILVKVYLNLATQNLSSDITNNAMFIITQPAVK